MSRWHCAPGDLAPDVMMLNGQRRSETITSQTRRDDHCAEGMISRLIEGEDNAQSDTSAAVTRSQDRHVKHLG